MKVIPELTSNMKAKERYWELRRVHRVNWWLNAMENTKAVIRVTVDLAQIAMAIFIVIACLAVIA